jgi:hypothetical protein
MSDNEEERRVKARHDVTQYYQRRSVKRTTSQQQLPRGDMLINGAPDSNANSSSDDDVEDETYMPSPRDCPHGEGLASASGSGAVRDEEIEEEDDGADGDDGEGEEETFDVEEINPPNYEHMGTPIFRKPLNPDWRAKVSYKGKSELVREKRKENP